MTTPHVNKNLELIERLRGLAYRALDAHDGQIIADAITALTAKTATIELLQREVVGLRHLMQRMTVDPSAQNDTAVRND